MILTNHFKQRCNQRGFKDGWADMVIPVGDLIEQEEKGLIIYFDEARAEKLKKAFANAEGEARQRERSLRREKKKAVKQGDNESVSKLEEAIRQERFERKKARRKKRCVKPGYLILEKAIIDGQTSETELAAVTAAHKYRKFNKVSKNIDK